MRRDEGWVEGDPQSRFSRALHEPVDEPNGLGQQLLADVVGRQRIFDEAGVRTGKGNVQIGHETRTDRGPGVDDQPNVTSFRHPGDIAGHGHAPDMGRVRLDEVERIGIEKAGELVEAGQALTSGDRDPRRAA